MSNYLNYELSHTSKYIDPIDDVIKWLDDLGLSGSKSRYSKYKNHINNFHTKPNTENFKILNSSAQECIQIIQIFNSFKDQKCTNFINRLKKVTSGTTFYEPQTKNDTTRDFLYELLIASFFQRKGYKIDFNQSTTDVVAIDNNFTIYIECKRLKSINRFEKNFKKACNQLPKINNKSNCVNLVFIDIYNCIANKITKSTYTDIFEMQKYLNYILENNFRKTKKDIIETILTKYLEKTFGAIFTTMQCLWLTNMTPHFFQDYKCVTSSKISDTNYKILTTVLNLP